MERVVRLSDLIDGLPVRMVRGSAAVLIRDVVEDSRQASPGCLYIARRGMKADGRKFISDAMMGGAKAVLTDDDCPIPPGVAVLIAPDVPTVAAHLAERFHGSPSRTLKLIGITGTNGKTTTAHLVHHLLNGAGLRCGLLGTVRTDDGRRLAPATLTTPGAIELSRLMRSMVDARCRACVMEVSSHALDQKRTAALVFNIGVFTNFSGDHLDYHRTMEEYLSAKAKLFEALPPDGWAVINVDDSASAELIARMRSKLVTCAIESASADCRAAVIRQTMTHTQARFVGPWGEIECELSLLGRHNVMNALEALAVCDVMGVGKDALGAGLESCHAPPGRLEPVTSPDHEFAVLVDYAHTDDALEHALRALRSIGPAGGKLGVVFGCGGDRDRTKRPRMANTAWKYADQVIITSDNPRTEDPQAIIDEIAKGVPPEREADTLCILDREEAIHTAIERAEPGDVILIAGKGHENYQIVGNVTRPFDDREVAKAALSRRTMTAPVP